MTRLTFAILIATFAIATPAPAQTEYQTPGSRSTVYQRGDTLFWIQRLAKPDTLGRTVDTVRVHFVGDSSFLIRGGKVVKPFSPFVTKQFRFMLSSAMDWAEIRKKLAIPDSIR